MPDLSAGPLTAKPHHLNKGANPLVNGWLTISPIRRRGTE